MLHIRLLRALIERTGAEPERALGYAHQLRRLSPDNQNLAREIEVLSRAARQNAMTAQPAARRCALPGRDRSSGISCAIAPPTRATGCCRCIVRAFARGRKAASHHFVLRPCSCRIVRGGRPKRFPIDPSQGPSALTSDRMSSSRRARRSSSQRLTRATTVTCRLIAIPRRWRRGPRWRRTAGSARAD